VRGKRKYSQPVAGRCVGCRRFTGKTCPECDRAACLGCTLRGACPECLERRNEIEAREAEEWVAKQGAEDDMEG